MVIIPKQRVKDVLTIVRRWPKNIEVPYLDVDEDGELYLSVFNDKGFIVVGLLFNGSNHMFAYSIDNGNGNPNRGEYNAQNSSDVSKFFCKLSQLNV